MTGPSLHTAVLFSNPPEAKVVIMILLGWSNNPFGGCELTVTMCWVMITLGTKGLHLCVNKQYHAASTGPGHAPVMGMVKMTRL